MALYNSFGTLTHCKRTSRVSPLRVVLGKNMRQGWNNKPTAKQREGASFLRPFSLGDSNHFRTKARSIGAELTRFACFDWQMGKYFILFYFSFQDFDLLKAELTVTDHVLEANIQPRRRCFHMYRHSIQFHEFSSRGTVILLETVVQLDIHYFIP